MLNEIGRPLINFLVFICMHARCVVVYYICIPTGTGTDIVRYKIGYKKNLLDVL
jgi:hypothetical protein